MNPPRMARCRSSPSRSSGSGWTLTLVSADLTGQVNILRTVVLILLGPGNFITLLVHCVLSSGTTAEMLAAFASALL